MEKNTHIMNDFGQRPQMAQNRRRAFFVRFFFLSLIRGRVEAEHFFLNADVFFLAFDYMGKLEQNRAPRRAPKKFGDVHGRYSKKTFKKMTI